MNDSIDRSRRFEVLIASQVSANRFSAGRQWGIITEKAHHIVPALLEQRDETLADESVAPGHKDSHSLLQSD